MAKKKLKPEPEEDFDLEGEESDEPAVSHVVNVVYDIEKKKGKKFAVMKIELTASMQYTKEQIGKDFDTHARAYHELIKQLANKYIKGDV